MIYDQRTIPSGHGKFPAIVFICQPKERDREHALHLIFSEKQDGRPFDDPNHWRDAETCDGDHVHDVSQHADFLRVNSNLFVGFA